MRAVIQRVRDATVTVDGEQVGAIGRGLLVYIGVEEGDTDEDARYVAGKVSGLRVFPDGEGKMNLALGDLDADAGILAVSQFTLLGDLRKGRRPSYNRAARPELGERLYETVVHEWRIAGFAVATGRFGAHMDVGYTNDGPVTLLLDSRVR